MKIILISLILISFNLVILAVPIPASPVHTIWSNRDNGIARILLLEKDKDRLLRRIEEDKSFREAFKRVGAERLQYETVPDSTGDVWGPMSDAWDTHSSLDNLISKIAENNTPALGDKRWTTWFWRQFSTT
jgi:hypothetical protein